MVDPGKYAARLAVDTIAYLNRAVEQSKLTHAQLADKVGVAEARVTEILESDGNLRVATVGKMFAALGYRVQLTLEPLE